MSKVDWSLAPKDATHFGQGEDCGYWAKLDGGKQYFINISTWDNGKWKESYEPYDVSHLVERTPKPWSGPEDGLPPVGLEVQRMSGRIWVDSKALAHSPCGKFCAYADDHGMNWGGALMFRPTKTPEQVAADKRETAIRELMDIAQVDCRVTAARLVDAGFKREVV